MKAKSLRRGHIIVHPEWGEQVVRTARVEHEVPGDPIVVVQLANGMDWSYKVNDDVPLVKP